LCQKVETQLVWEPLQKSEESVEKSSFFGKIRKFVFAHGAG